MAQANFQGPVRSLSGFYAQGPNTVVNLTAATATLDLPTYAGKLIRVNNATGVYTLPLINATSDATGPGPGPDPNTLNNQGATFSFWIETAATNLQIKCQAGNTFVGAVQILSVAAITGYVSSANTTITMNGTTQGGVAGSFITVVPISAAKYAITYSYLLGSGVAATPFS